MPFPVACYCGTRLGVLETKIRDAFLEHDHVWQHALDALDISRDCCRRTIICYVPQEEMQLVYDLADSALPPNMDMHERVKISTMNDAADEGQTKVVRSYVCR